MTTGSDVTLEQEVVQPVQDVDEQEGEREEGARAAVDVVGVLDVEHRRHAAGRVFNGRQATPLARPVGRLRALLHDG